MRRCHLPLLLLALAAVFFWRLWLAPDGFLYPPESLYSDLTITHWPNALFIRHSIETWGQIPLWRPLILGGEPFAANPLSGLWYPPNLLLLILPLAPAFNLLFILHTAWAGWGGYWLARSTESTRAGGLLAAFTLMFASKAVAHLAAGHVGLYCAWAWLPWAFWAVRRLAQRGRSGDVATAAVVLACLILADLRLGFYGGLAAGIYALTIAFSPPPSPSPSPSTSTLTSTLILTLTLTSTLTSTLTLTAGRLNRGGLSLEESGILSLPPRYLMGLLIADHGGFHEWMTYLGAVGLLLAVVGVARWRGRERWWWGCLALAAAVYSLGIYTPLYGLLYQIFPPLGYLRGPARAWFLVILSVAVLAAQGLTALEQGGRLSRRRAGLVATGLAGAALVGGAGGLVLRLPANVVAAAVVWPMAGMLVALALALPPRVGGGRGGAKVSLFAGLVLALALADLWVVGFTLYRVRPADDVLAEGEAAAAYLATQPRPFRVYSPSYSIPQHTGAVYAIETVDGVDPFQLADYAAFMRAATGVNLPGYSVTIPSFPEAAEGEDALLAHRDVTPDLRLLGLLNVRYLAAAYPLDGVLSLVLSPVEGLSKEAEGLTGLGERGGVHLYRNEQALPRAFVVGRAETVEGLDGALVWLAENDPAEAAAVEGGPPLEGPEAMWDAHILQLTPNRVQVEAQGPGLLVLSEVYDPDWRVWVDGQETEMYRTDGILRGVYLETGLHQVTFVYRPAGLGVGCVATMAGLIVTAALFLIGRKT